MLTYLEMVQTFHKALSPEEVAVVVFLLMSDNSSTSSNVSFCFKWQGKNQM